MAQIPLKFDRGESVSCEICLKEFCDCKLIAELRAENARLQKECDGFERAMFNLFNQDENSQKKIFGIESKLARMIGLLYESKQVIDSIIVFCDDKRLKRAYLLDLAKRLKEILAEDSPKEAI